MNPYAPPTNALSGNGASKNPRRASVLLIRAFGLFHGGLALILSIVTATLLRQGLSRLASLNNEALLRELAHPDLYVRSQKAAAALDLSIAALAMAAAVGVALVSGLRRLRRWSRRLTMVQVVLLASAVSLPIIQYSRHTDFITAFSYIVPYLTPVLILGLFSLLLWLPSISAGFSETVEASLDASVPPGKEQP